MTTRHPLAWDLRFLTRVALDTIRELIRGDRP